MVFIFAVITIQSTEKNRFVQPKQPTLPGNDLSHLYALVNTTKSPLKPLVWKPLLP